MVTDFEGEQGGAADTRELRAIDLLESPHGSVERLDELTYRVRSSTGRGFYRVRRKGGLWTCECGDWEERHLPCKHIIAVGRSKDPDPPTLVEVIPDGVVERYSQDWPAYDAAQQAEHPMFDALLWDLLEQVPEPESPPGKRGRKPISLRTQLLVAVKKVHLVESCRRVRGLLGTIYAGGHGILPKVPNYAIPSRLFNRPETTALLVDLIRKSSVIFAPLEDSGTVAIDSTGFCTSQMGSYCTEKHDPFRKHGWVKAHVVVGVQTHGVLEVRVTDEHGADYNQFAPIIRNLVERDFPLKEVCADKAYSGRSNYALAEELGFNLYAPFKSMDTGRSSNRGHSAKNGRGATSRLWKKMFHLFQLHRDEWEPKYHPRSNVEATFSAIKRKMGEPLLSKNPTARLNELLAKLLAYNIGVIVHEIFEHGIDPGVTGVARPAPRPRIPKPRADPYGEGVLCDFIAEPVTEIVDSARQP
jgi:hypothetical protein